MLSYQVGYFLRQNATMYPDRIALVHKSKKITYRELNAMANRLGNSLLAQGVKKQDRVAYLFRNGIESVISWWATQKIGATAVPVNTNLLAGEIASMLNDVQCKVLIYHNSFSEAAQRLAYECKTLQRLICGSSDSLHRDSLDEILRLGMESEPDVDIQACDESLILFTSGTSGKPKAVMRSQQIVREYALMMAIENHSSRRVEAVITHMRLFHTGGWLNMMRMTVLGGTLVLLDSVDPEEVFSQIENQHATQVFMLPPVMYQRLYDSAVWAGFDRSSVKDVFCSGGKCSYEYAMSIFEMFPGATLRFSWGSTETCTPTSAYLTKEEILTRPELVGTCGKRSALCEIRLVDECGHDVPDGVVGEAVVRSSMVFRGYINAPALDSRAFDTDGWFHTEDLMRRSADGYYFILDRKKDMIKTGGENVYAQEVENTLRDHPAITDCAVVGIPDKQYGETVAVAIVLKPGAELDGKEFSAFCKARMASYRKPRYWAFLDRLPVNSINKIQKSVLRAQAETLFRPIEGGDQ